MYNYPKAAARLIRRKCDLADIMAPNSQRGGSELYWLLPYESAARLGPLA